MKNNTPRTRSKKSGVTAAICCAFTVPALAIAANAYADDSVTPPAPEASNAAPAAQALSSPAQVSQAQPANKRRADQGGQIRNDQPDTTNALVNAEASQTVTPPEPPSSQAASKGFIADSHLNLQLRNYADYFQAPPSLYRHAWVQGAQVNYESGFTQGLVGFGVDASLFGALKLDGGNGAGNMVHVGKSGGGTRIDRLTYLGGTWHYAKNGEMSLYIDQADDVWRQYYGSVSQSFGDPTTIKWSGLANIYSTHDTGASRQGHINSNAYSLSVSAQHGPHALLLGQQVLGDQFFDYVNETNGIYLTNSMDVDYNAPHEQSLQLRYTFDGKFTRACPDSRQCCGVRTAGAPMHRRALRRMRRPEPRCTICTGRTASPCTAIITSSASFRAIRCKAAASRTRRSRSSPCGTTAALTTRTATTWNTVWS
ncbi:MAG: Outer membrane low permeability porin, OprD family [uncultured Paraburkholderia sp.]|nr:MAG: Outer membrane low permeability porin, OprD family [uncultured Paraburkholderia sp.]CAH2928258.1 MAG: Outer membrane low permeability porin, OprD family [uncultured Paraburkholderia sp.]